MRKWFKEFIGRYIGRSQYKKNVLIMVVGRVAAQAIPILITPILTRLYSPNDFGVFGVFLTIISIVAMASNGRYCLSIILPKDEDKVKKLFFLVLFASNPSFLYLQMSTIFSIANICL